ncbi:TRAP transporter small permease subunit [Campylobacter sp. faydin G-24]|uniref:TRAP transporter small permease subunit n=1 Tax=Campylobacter anatolicus TaxID=2829105 RepID=A0ABS5HFN6_9BACT|nr:TRAP transporter small permease subunit [Campylobacter anatolicus]MBR8463084.1 TRAP transporter small permease subunit [Campylobacter anatolicus]
MSKIERFFDKFGNFIGYICMILMTLMIVDVFFNVIARYFFKYGNVGFQELEWHLFSVIFLLGMSYALKEDAHVRVDIFYAKFNPKTKAMINMLGAIFFIIPFALLIGFLSIDFVFEAFTSNEASADPGGLTHRWIVKSFIPISVFLLIFFAIGFFIKNLNKYLVAKKD